MRVATIDNVIKDFCQEVVHALESPGQARGGVA